MAISDDATPPKRRSNGIRYIYRYRYPQWKHAHSRCYGAARVGFDWPDTNGVTEKIAEESAELAHEIENANTKAIAEEYGDLLFSVAVLGQHLKVDAEQALVAANRKFERRFRGVEERLLAQGKTPSESTLEEMDSLWDEVKHAERNRS